MPIIEVNVVHQIISSSLNDDGCLRVVRWKRAEIRKKNTEQRRGGGEEGREEEEGRPTNP